MERKENIKLMMTDEERLALFELANSHGLTVSQTVELILLPEVLKSIIDEYNNQSK